VATLSNTYYSSATTATMDRRLDPSKREIRLLTLLPGENDASIDCSLCITSLGDYSTYKEGVYQWSTNKTFTHGEFKNDPSQQSMKHYHTLGAVPSLRGEKSG
jgi:hypothetical protein